MPLSSSCPVREHSSVPDLKRARFSEFVFERLRDWRRSGFKTALLTLVNVEGSSPRPVGSQLAVNERGEYVGLVSGGCLESALVAEAQICMDRQTSRWVRYGRDSDYFDIQLPCSSGVDILIQPLMAEETWPEYLCDLYLSRRPAIWQYNLLTQCNTVETKVADTPLCINRQYSRRQMERDFKSFQKWFSPGHRIVVVGEGEVFDSFVQLTQLFDFDLLAYSHKTAQGDLKPEYGPRYRRIENWRPQVLDRWTSLVILSHDHTWEQPILLQALASEVGFISALGSKRTQSQRLKLLLAEGVDKRRIAMIKGPAGLDIGGHSPAEIALSILAEIVANKNRKCAAKR